ncbi:MAG: hypothetical protein FRX49_08246 [Trebouxia sp. A1-2]|nr:MAG: hypothetical protein FRX49_08246 [Trebouxia sp. A1-2]
MSQPNFPKVTLAQCTGVTPAPVCQPANLSQREANEQKFTSVHAAQIDSRQPLHDNNSQTSPCSNNSHKRSRTTSDSIVITPSDKRQTVLALSPEKPLPAGQQWTTLEVQRVLSLTPGTRPAFKHPDCQHDSLETIQTNTAHKSPASCSPGSTVAVDDSPMRHTGPINTPYTEAKACASEQQGMQSMMPTDAYPATELQLPDIPPTQLAYAATALDLLLCESTQVVGDPASAIIASKPSSAGAVGGHGGLPIVSAQQELALNLGNAEGSTATPVMIPAPAQMESLEGTQAEADALIEESSYWVINTNDDEGHEERAWGALILHISQSTFAEVAAALGQPFSSWAKTKSFSAVDRLLWAARIHVDRVNFSFEGGLDTIPLSTETDWVEGEMCSPSEAAERLATFEAEGHITFAHHPPFSCSAAGSSAPGFELTQGTQFGTVIEEAAAIIKYSQMHAAHPPVPRLSPVPVVESQLQRHASQGMLSLASQQAVGRCSVTVALAGPAQPEAQPTSQAATQLPSDLPAVASQDDAIAAPCGRGQQASCAGKAQPVAVQVSSHHATPLPEGPAASQVAGALHSQADKSRIRPEDLASDPGTQDLRQHCAPELEAPANTSAAAAAADIMQAGSPTQCMEDVMGDMAATEVQHPPAHCFQLPLSPQAAAAEVDPAEIPAAQVMTVADTVELPAAEPGAVEEDLPVQKAASPATIPAEMHRPAQAHQPLPDSPTQNLHLHLTCLESQAAEEHRLPAVTSPPQQQLRLQSINLQSSQAAQHAEQRAEHGEDEPCEVFNSPARLSLNLDTQLPDHELVPPASKAVPGARLQRSPAVRSGWWGQPWSVAQQPEETGPSPAGGVWCALADLDAAAEGTEVTPSGLRPPRGPSSTPLIQPAASDGSPHASSPISAGRHPTSKPHGRSTQQELIIADSEEPLVLHRQHGPAKRAFLDAHALPCSSPNSPPDPLCSYVPATADIASPMKGAQKKGGSPKAKPGKVGEVAAGGLGRVPKLADDEALPDGAPVHGKQAKHAARPGKGKSKRKTKAAPQMGPPGARYRAGLPAPRYQSHHPKPCTTPPLAANRLQPHIQIPAQKDAAAHQQQSLLVAESAGKDAAALHACTMEQLPLGANALNSCTLEQLPQGSRVCSPAVASPLMDRSSSPVVMPAGMLAGHGPGLGAGLRGAGLSARNAVAALCSARRQTAEPRNAYSFPDSLSPPAEADGAEPHCSSPTGINGTGPAQQAKHGQHRASAVAKVHLPDATARLQASCLAEDRTISAPPQQSRRAWQLKASAQVSEGLNLRVSFDDNNSLIVDEHDDMVGHSQLDSDMLQASPQAPADQGNVADDAAAVKRDFVDCEEEGPVDAEASNEEGVEVFAAGSAADEALAMPEPGCKRKRSKLQHSRMREALLDEAADPDSEPAAAATPVIPVKPAGQLKVRLPPLGCSKCRWSAKGCKKCRHDREAALQRQQAGSNLYDVSWVLQAVGGADAEAGIPAEQPAGDVRKAVASPGSNQASPCINQHAQAPHHASSVPAEPATNGQGRRRTRRSAGPELLGQTRGNASVSPTPAEPSHGGPVAARGRRSGGLAPAEQPLPEQPPKGCKRKSGSAADVERAKKVMAQQRRAASSSPAVVLATAGQDRKAGQGRADQQDRQGRAAPSSPALSSPGGSRAMHRHRRSSLGGGGVLPFGGHSFLLTAYSDERQKERICHKITQLGGHVLEDIPKPQGSRRASLAGNASHPVLALFAGQPIRTTKVMYAYIKGIPIVKESWLMACVSAHKLLPFDALHVEGGQGNEGHQAFQGLRLHLAGSPAWEPSFGRLIQHAGGHLVSWVGDSTSPGGVHHAIQAPCDCILSDFPDGSDELQQVHRLARRLRVPVKGKAWAIIGFKDGKLPALPSPSPTKPSKLPPSSPPLPSAITVPSPAGQATRGQTRHAAAVANPGSAARRQSRGATHASHAHGDADAGMQGRSSRMRKRRRVDLVIPEQQPEEERAAGSAWAAHPADPEAEEAQVDQLHDDRAVATAGNQQPRHLHRRSEQDEREGLCNAAGIGVVVADSMEFGSCMAAASADWVGPSIEPPTGLDLTPSQHQTFYAAFARGGVVVEVGDFVELSPVPGEDLTRLVQVAALWSEPTQARQRMLASCHRFYRASETCIQYGFPPHEVFSSQDIEAKVPLLAVLCKCSIVYGRNGPTGNHNYLCPFAYDYASNSLRGH